jgi:hypothetical protein
MIFSVHFSELYLIYYHFLKFKQISQNFKSEKNWKKGNHSNSFGPALGPRPHGLCLAQ